MSIPERYKYPFDKTGMSPNNLVYPEKRTLTKQIRTIVPKEGAYFTQSLIITFNGKTLVRGVDYKPTFLAEKATVRTNKEVCGGIHFINDKVIGEVTLSYQVLGGALSEFVEANRSLIDVLDGNNGAIHWDQIIELPEAFVPTRHLHHADDIIGTTPLVIEMQGIRRAIENLRSHRNVALYRLIGSIHTRVNNFIESYNDNDSYLRDTVEDLKQRVGQEKLVTEPVFNLAKRALDKRIDGFENGLNEFRNQQNEKNRQFTQQIEGLTARQNELRQDHDTLKSRVDNLSIKTIYSGSQQNGQFITVSRSGDVWTINQKDPTWLVPILNRITTQEGKTSQLETGLQNAEGRIGKIEEELPTFRNYQLLIRANQERIETVNNTLNNKVDDAVEGLNQQHRQLQTKVDKNKVDTDKKIKEVEDSILPSIKVITDPLAAKDVVHDNAIEDIRSKATVLTAKVDGYIRTNDQRVSNAEKAHADFKKQQEAFNEGIQEMLDSVDVNVTYSGERENGEFISLEKVGRVFNIKYKDPSWLTPLETRVDNLESSSASLGNRVAESERKIAEHDSHLAEHDKYEGKIQTLRGEYDATRNEHKSLLDGLRTDVNNHQQDFDKRIKNLVEEDSKLKQRVNELENATNGLDVITQYDGSLGKQNFISVEREGNVFKLRVQDPNGLHGTIERVGAVENRAASLEGRAEDLEAKTDATNIQLASDKEELKGDIKNLSDTLKAKDASLDEELKDLAKKEEAFETETRPRLAALESGLTNHASEIGSLKQKLNKNTVEAQYVGLEAEGGQFVTVTEKEGGGYIVKQDDPKWLKVLRDNIDTLQTSGSDHGERIDSLETKVDALTDTTNEQDNRLRDQLAKINALQEADRTQTKKHDILESKVDSFKSAAEMRLDRGDRERVALSERIVPLEDWKRQFNIVAKYTGERKNGSYLTVSGSEDKHTWTISYSDPVWLKELQDTIAARGTDTASLKQKADEQEAKLSELNNKLEANKADDVKLSDKVTALGNQVNGIENNLNRLQSDFTSNKTATDKRIDLNRDNILANDGRISTLESWKQNLNLKVEYRGSRKDGNFITLETLAEGKGWKINYLDPSWLAPLLEKVTNQGKQLDTLQGTSGSQNEKQTQLEAALDALTNRTGTLETNVTNLKKKDDELEGKLGAESTKARNAETALGQRIDELTNRHETLVNSMDGRIQNGFNQHHAPFANRINDAEVKARATDKRIGDLEESIDAIDNTRGEEIAALRDSVTELSGGSSQRSEALERRVTQLEKDRDATNKNLNDFKTKQEELHLTLDTNLETTRQAIKGITAVNETQSDEIAKLKAAKDSHATQLQTLSGKLDKVATKEELKASDVKNAGLVQSAKDELNAKVDAVKAELNGTSNDKERELKAYADKVANNVLQTVNQSTDRLGSQINRLSVDVGDAAANANKVNRDLDAWKQKSPERLNNQHTKVTLPAINSAVEKLKQAMESKHEQEHEDLRLYKEAVNEMFNAFNLTFRREDGHYLSVSTMDPENLPGAHIDIESSEVAVDDFPSYKKRDISDVMNDWKIIHPTSSYPYSRFQPIEIGVDVRVKKQGTEFKFGYLCFGSRDVTATPIHEGEVSIDKNRTVELANIIETSDGYRVDLGTKMSPNSGLYVYPKTGVEEGNVHSAQYFPITSMDNPSSNRLINISVEKQLEIDPSKTYLASVALAESEKYFITDEVEHPYRNGEWQRVKLRIEGGWWSSATLENHSGLKPFFGTNFVVPSIKVNDETGIEYRNFYVRPVDEEVTFDKLKGVDAYLEKWLAKKIAGEAERPADSRWDLSRFRIQPGAENFSSVSVDENDNLEVKGIVYYDTVGKGKRGVFAPTTEIAITSSKNWNVPEEYDGRVALVTVRASSRSEVGKVIHSCVRQVMVTLTGGTEVPIQVGDISSFGTHVTVSNAIDYPDAIVGRIESPAGSRVNPGVVSIKV